MKSFGWMLALVLMATACSSEAEVTEEVTEKIVFDPLALIGSVEKHDEAAGAIVPDGAQLEVIAEGHGFTEGPVWVPALDAILYTDIKKNSVYKWSAKDGASLWLTPSGYTGEKPRKRGAGANGLVLDGEDNLILAQHGDRRLVRLKDDVTTASPSAEFETLASHYEGKRLNSPNDIALRRNGDLYFTDPPYGLERGEKDPARELDFQGVYRRAADGTVTLLTDELSRPNGIVFSEDQKTLYVANSGKPRVIMSYPVLDDGTIGKGEVFYGSSGDGMAVDQMGNVYIAGPQKSVIIVSPEGKLLASLKTGHQTTNCVFGEDGSTLFITASAYLIRVRLNVKGLGF